MPAVFLPLLPLVLAAALTFGLFTSMDTRSARYLDACRVGSLRAAENGVLVVQSLVDLNPMAKLLGLQRVKAELRLSKALAYRNPKTIAIARSQLEEILKKQGALDKSQKAMIASYFALLKEGAFEIEQRIRGSGTTNLTNEKLAFLLVISEFHLPLNPEVDGKPAPEYVHNLAYSHSFFAKWSLDFAVDLLGHKPSIRLNQQCGAKIEKRGTKWFANLIKDKFL